MSARAWVVGWALALAAGAAQASGLSAPFVGTTASSPVHADPAAVYWNPAMLTHVGLEVMPSLGLGVLDVRYTRERRGRYQFSDALRFDTPVPAGDLDPGRTGPDHPVQATEPLLVPAVFGALPLPETGGDVVLGGGIYVPFAALLTFPGDGAQRFALESVQMAAVEIAPAAAWRLDPRLSVGVGGALVLGYLDLSKTVDLAGTELLRDTFAEPPIGQPNAFGPDAPPEVRELDVLARPVRIGPALGLSWAARAGLTYTPAPDWRLGLSYTHRGPLTLRGPFDLDLDDPLFTRDLAPQGLRYPARVHGKAEVDFPLPSSLHGGVRWQAAPRLELAATFAWFRYSVVESLDARLESNELVQPELGLGRTASVQIPRDWRDSFQVDARGVYSAPAGWHLGALLGYHSPVSPDETLDVASPDGHRLVAAVLTGLRIGRIEWLADLQLQYVLPRETHRSTHDLSNGTYDLLLLTATAAARLHFD